VSDAPALAPDHIKLRSAGAAQSRHALGDKARGRRLRRPCPGGSRLTLEQQLVSVWEGLLATGAAECPVCGGRLEQEGEHGRCGGCQAQVA
jgi:hypothetical protein